MDFAIPTHSKKAVRRAGELISAGKGSRDEVEAAREVVADFRSAHAYPLLSVTNNVRNKALEVSQSAIVAQRMKRLPTILDKLERHPDMVLTTMQDFGGCRVIVDSLDQVEALRTKLWNAKRAQNRIVKEYDYIDRPRESGYRGIHLIFDYRASKTVYHGYRVELQIRTGLQHSWATAVETMDLFAGTELKYGKGDPAIRRYFSVVSSLMAIREGAEQTAGATGSVEDLSKELVELDATLHVLDRLGNYASVVNDHAKKGRRTYLTLELEREAQRLQVSVHASQAAAEARLDELESKNDDDLDAVLVGGLQVSQLKAAYPNYFADTSNFTQFVAEQISTL